MCTFKYAKHFTCYLIKFSNNLRGRGERRQGEKEGKREVEKGKEREQRREEGVKRGRKGERKDEFLISFYV